MEEKLEPDDIGCHICLEILYEPITMPCHHRMCKVSILSFPTQLYCLNIYFQCDSCFKHSNILFQTCYLTNINETSINCPFCKKRIGTWNRRAKDVNNRKYRTRYLCYTINNKHIFSPQITTQIKS